jgi:uncharacterized membrane protein YkoI
LLLIIIGIVVTIKSGIKVFSRREFFSLVCTVVAAAALSDSALAASGSDRSSDGHSENHIENHTETEHTETEHNQGGDSDNGENGENDSGNAGESESGSSDQGASDSLKSGSSKGVSTTQDEARAAVKSGKAASLPLVLAFMENHFPGEVLDVKLLQNPKGYVYEVKYLAESSLLQVVTLDAKTLKTL